MPIQDKPIEVYLIRHGYSVANRMTTKSSDGRMPPLRNLLLKMLEPDPSLTTTGIVQSQHAARYATRIKPDYIFASVLSRAQQTALLMFPTEQPVIVAPYLKEKSNPLDQLLYVSDNKPFMDIITQQEKRHNTMSIADINRLRYSPEVVTKEGPYCMYKRRDVYRDGDIGDFLRDFLKGFLEEHEQEVKRKKKVRVAVVCHGNVLRSYFGKRIARMNNNIIVKTSFPCIEDLSVGSARVEVLFPGYKAVKRVCNETTVVKKC